MAPFHGSLASEWLLCIAIFYAKDACTLSAFSGGELLTCYVLSLLMAPVLCPLASEWLLCLSAFQAC
jgi:hypothetical protein